MKNTVLFSLLCILLRQAAPAWADEFGPDRLLGFTRYLIGKQEYYRALVELKRIGSYHPGYISPAAFQVTELYLLSRGKQYSDIIDMKLMPGDAHLAAAGLVFKCDAAIGASDIAGLDTLVAGWRSGADPYFDGLVKKRRLYSSLVSGRYGAAEAVCGPPGAPDYGACRELIAMARRDFGGGKMPWLAAVLGIVPGAGYLYSGEIATGVFAFLLIAADAVLTYFAFRTHNDVIGYFTGVAGGLLYAGSMAGGYFAAQRYNVRRFETSRTSLSDTMKLGDDRKELFNRYGIGSDGKQ